MLIGTVAVLLLAAPAPLPTPDPVPVAVAEGAIEVDGVLDEPAWKAAVPIDVAWEWFPGDNVPAPVATQVFVTYDTSRLYVGFRALDPDPSQIRARYQERDEATLDDTVGFMLDPFLDRRRAYQFRINALGVQMDAINSDVEGTEDWAWDAVWDSAARIGTDGYVVEVAIPLQQLRVPAGSGPGAWGFLAMRDWPRSVRHRMNSVRTDPNRNCNICQFQDVTGIRAASTGHNVEITPTLTGQVRQQLEGTRLETTDEDLDPGLSARWGVTSGTSLQLTLNPDFSQVEADAAQLDVNTRFALFYPEKRPFFLEGGDLFETQIPLGFTRTVADPDGGLKITGKAGGHTYAALVARDHVTNVLVPGSESDDLATLEGENTAGLFRYRHDFGARTSIGGFLSGRSGQDYSNLVTAADGYHRLTEQDTLRFQLAASRTDYPDAMAAGYGQAADAFTGRAILGRYNHADKNWGWQARYEERSPGFRADSGFVSQVGVRAGQANVQRRFWGAPDRWFTNFVVAASADTTHEWDGRWHEWGSDFTLEWQGPRQADVWYTLAPNRDHYAGQAWNHLRQSAGGQFQATADLTLELDGAWGETVDFANARSARFLTLSPEVGVRAGRRLAAELEWDHQTLSTPEGARIYTVDLPQARVLFHFDRRSYVRAILQYRMLEREPEQYLEPVRPEEKSLLTQFLFTYRLNAQTVAMVGYSDTHLGDDAVDLRQVDRTVFVKLSYAWLF